jgi:alpha/beta superfamily hydrolase
VEGTFDLVGRRHLESLAAGRRAVARRPLEKAVTVALDGGELALEGIFLAGEGQDGAGAVVAPPHPLYGGSMDHPACNELAYACCATGIASLRFNWRGVGASAGAPSSESADADADYCAATRYLAETVDGPLLAAGYSFGAVTALRVASREPRIRRLLLLAPPLPILDRDLFVAYKGSVLVIAAGHDEFSPASELRTLTEALPRARFQLIAEADHFFMAGLADVARAARDWL